MTILRNFIFQRDKDGFLIYIPKCNYSVETTHIYNSKGEFYLGDGEYGHGALDIVSEWKETINEEELDEIAYKTASPSLQMGIHSLKLYKDGFKAGYRKAKEE